MKKHIWIAFFLGILTVTGVQAQDKPTFGIRAGANFADWRGELYDGFSELLEGTGALTAEGRTGFHAGVYMDLALSPRVAIEPAVYYSTKGVRISQRLMDGTMVGGLLNVRASVANVSHYIDVPLNVRVNLTEGLHVFGGPQVSYLVKNNVRAEAGLLGFSVGHTVPVDPGLRTWDAGITAGIGYEFGNGVNLRAGYDHGLTTLDEGRGDFEAYNRVIKLSVGYSF